MISGTDWGAAIERSSHCSAQVDQQALHLRSLSNNIKGRTRKDSDIANYRDLICTGQYQIELIMNII
jgi:hypothetical protein